MLIEQHRSKQQNTFEVAGKTCRLPWDCIFYILLVLTLVGEQIFKRFKSEPLFSGAYIKRPQHPSLSLSRCRISPSQPHHTSLTRHLIWLLSAWSLSLSVWFCLNKLLWRSVPTQNQFSAMTWFAFLCPNSCLGPFNGWSNILIVR